MAKQNTAQRCLDAEWLIKMGNIPGEIKEFFEALPGQTLLIKGKPGTGKTILSLEILMEVCEERNGLYLSTRLTPSRLYHFFPWIKEIVPEKNVVNATQSKILNSMSKLVSSRHSKFDFGATLDFFKVLYEDAEDMDNPMVVIDSWDAVLNYLKLEEEGAALAQSLCEFCRELGTHLIFVSETDKQTALDYIVDGAVTLLDTEIRGEAVGGQVYASQLESRTAREIELNKLRGVKRKQKSYVFTLKDGKFKYFPPYYRTVIPKLKPLPDVDEEHRSSGIKDFDEITGGLEKGGLTLFEIEHGVGLRYVPFLDQIAMSLAAKNLGVVRIRSVGAELAKHSKLFRNVKGIYTYKPKVWLGETRWGSVNLETTKNIPVPEALLQEQFLMESWKEFLSFVGKLKEKHPGIVFFLGLDMLETLYGVENTLKFLDAATRSAVENEEIFIGVVKRGMKSIEMITKLANIHFISKDLMGSLFIFGVQPRTGLYYVSSDEEGIHLTPVE